MSQQIRCPNCGADHSLVNPGITMLVCQHCNTTVYWGQDQELNSGTKSILPESDSRLFMHATGQLNGNGYEVVGHVRYDHGKGAWDEWYLQLDDDSLAWVSEDERELSLETAICPDENLPNSSSLKIGAPLSIADIKYTVREIGKANYIGGQGQLPFTILPGEQYIYADLASLDGKHFATLEYDKEGDATCFVGQTLGHDELKIDDEKPPSTAKSKQGKHIKCVNCDAPLEVAKNREIQTQICEYCGAQLDLTRTETKILGINPPDIDPLFLFEVGQSGTFRNNKYEICGRMLYQDSEGYPSREYLLFNPEEGYLWLAEENNHFVLNRPTQTAPSRDPFNLKTKQQVTIGKNQFRFYESGSNRLVYIDGALPWLAKSGDTFRFADLVAPPQIFCAESDGQEVEYFHGNFMSGQEVWTAFELPGKPPPSLGIHPAQPFKRGTVTKLIMVIGAVFALINLGFVVWSTGQDGHAIFSKKLDTANYLNENISEPFKVGSEEIMGVQISAPLNNSWIAMDMALVNEKDEVILEADGDISYYHGVEDGEGWSEGSSSTTTFFKAPPSGTYRLLYKGSAGSGNTNGPPLGESLYLNLYQGGVLTRYFLMAFFITVLFPVFEIVRKSLFEQRRWAPVTEDDDDDSSDFDWD